MELQDFEGTFAYVNVTSSLASKNVTEVNQIVPAIPRGSQQSSAIYYYV